MLAIQRTSLWSLCALACFATTANAADCPDVKPVPGLNLTEWSRKSWYVQEQQLNGYQSAAELFCVVATYDNNESLKVPFFKGPVLAVHNYENKNMVNGPIESTDVNIPKGLCARQPKSDLAAELLVAPCFLPNLLAGPYWIVAFGADDTTGEYRWGAISGGAPTVKYSDGCTTKEKGVNGSGLWIFTREPVGSEATINEARKALSNLGYTLQRLKPVAQKGCTYKGFQLK
jgi:hypothetical protein|eukprot:Stramenopile-MAST_4_protein_2201